VRQILGARVAEVSSLAGLVGAGKPHEVLPLLCLNRLWSQFLSAV
jgi:hypothetical protein